ncbi:hypothetical protein I3843_13G071100 [Carya illinoinensis]|uniref:Uncharacterized protein n=1 Tax=Carya illinoinensis TaxID=32201 RepID=A0A8T1NHK5_CARIL|nr:uncharacterized protein LOC122291677 isoform X1 [Carya illinoinensis]XP_042955470.1 uncharacterized protein LOC122291677 isoform X1 [Carya illinoinensis]KAG6631336.1 hypothetical protein CIPAW_13G084600 [Carya illinoinensis]KAG6631337.1 hypothetical protein CIPAW_13G084600 [Carya illinoinensis]KAG6631338.1 hypothetical protein CIPAW_13G084600 [Carya illinoinensis]KAG6681257.1 hypothetical protein I3842_13G083200 [Carya illinoinensis]KAG6681258.1 hypothetical protein I3842_13G083200 [Carya 
MEYHSELKSNSSDQQHLETSGKLLLPQASQSVKLRERVKPETPNLSYSDLHHEITKNATKDIQPKSSDNLQKQQNGRKATEEDELVKYMSNLPSYLERGEKLQEKVLNVGVLDWGRLEKWHYGHKQVADESSQYSQSSSSTSSSSFSTDGSSAHSSRGHSRSPAHPRTRRTSLHCHLMESPIEDHSQDVQAFRESAVKFQDLKSAESNILSGQRKFIDQPLCNTVIKQEYKRKDPDPKINQDGGFIPNNLNYEVASCTKLKKKIQDGEIKKRAEKVREPKSNNIDQDVSAKCETVVLLLPRDLPQKHQSGMTQFSDLTALLGRRSAEASQRRFSERSKEICREVNSDIPHSCPLPFEVDSEHTHLKQPGTIDVESVSFSSTTSIPMSRSAKVGISPSGISPSRSRNFGEKKSTVISTNKTNEPSKGSDLNVNKFTDEKVRSTSPFRRLNIGLGKMSRSTNTQEGLDTQHTSSKYTSDKTVAYACSDMSNNDKPNATGKARSSPLRRLLDPLLKPKAASCHHCVEPLQRESISMDGACKNSGGRLDSSTVDFGKLKSETMVQALLRVAIKNDQPLITFAVDNGSDILAATMKKLSASRKGDYSSIYTFFTIREVKKKNGSWMNQGGRSKGKGPNYIPNVVAQMKVSDSEFSNLIGQPCMDHFSTREFVLFSVHLNQEDQQTSDFQPNDELAAVVVKIPNCITRSSIIGSKEWLPGMGGYSSTGEHTKKLPFIGIKDLFSATVILPSGVHSIPSKGGPSSLFERWKSGGLCDCGGWDLGCKLQILTNQNHSNKKLGSSKTCSTRDKIELFCQEGVHLNQPLFSLAPFKDEIYSVEFNSSLSNLQAFSICIAVLDSKKPCELSEPTDSSEGKTLEETISMQNDRIKAPDQSEELPARYVSYPPLSPVGRV